MYLRRKIDNQLDLWIKKESKSPALITGFATLVEAKTKNGNTKSSKTVMKNKDHYGKTQLIKIGDYNVSKVDDIITIPHYLTFALGKEKNSLDL